MNIKAYCYAEVKRHVVATFSMPLSTFPSSAAFRTVSKHLATVNLTTVDNKISYKILIFIIFILISSKNLVLARKVQPQDRENEFSAQRA
jgi:hypothetical protein